MMMKVLLWIAALSSLCLAVLGAEVTVLTDANFEHDTQATSGSTTGSWLVLFHDGNDQEVKSLLETPMAVAGEETDAEVEEGEESPEPPKKSILADDLLDEGIVTAIMDLSSNPKTVHRLKIPGTPHAVLLHKGKLYRTNSFEGLKDFAMSEFELSPPEDIPEEPSNWKGAKALAGILPTKMLVLGAAVFVLGAVTLVMYAKGATKEEATKKKE